MEKSKYNIDITEKNFIPIFDCMIIPGHPLYDITNKIKERVSKMSWDEVNEFLSGNGKKDNT